MLLRGLFAGLTLALCHPLLAQDNRGAAGVPETPKPGTSSNRVVCARKPEQTYALYVPSRYDANKRWPIIYIFDPAARGNIPLELMKDAAERHGFLVAASNNSRNGSWSVEIEAAQAMADDTHARFSIDEQRVYFGGFSGGARVASLIAQSCKCAAGVFLSGAGFSANAAPSRDVRFAVFAAVGMFDFNYPEVTQLDEKLDASGYQHALRYFDGTHQWAPAPVMEEALAWFRLVARKQTREPRDDSLVDVQRAAALARADQFEKSGDVYAAWHEYRQAAATFNGLADIAAFEQKERLLADQKAVKEGAKREKHDFDEQTALTADISAGLDSIRDASTSRSDVVSQTAQKIDELRMRATHEKHPDKERVLRRALGGVLVSSVEMGQERLAAKDVATAEAYFDLGTVADPDSVWAFSSLATARALEGNRKATLEALRHAREKSKDLTAFAAWLADEPAFAKFQDDPQFRKLLSNP